MNRLGHQNNGRKAKAMAPVLSIVVAVLAVSGVAAAQSPALQRLAPSDAAPAQVMAKVDLAAEFPQLQGYTFVQGLATIPPGAGRAWHSHAGVPEIVRIISGTLTDARNGGPPVAYGPGSTLINAGGVQHMWANLGTEPVVFVATQVHSPGH